MTEEAKKRLAEKEARYTAAIELREPDRVPMEINGNIFAVTDAGYTVGECIYDTTLEKYKDAATKFMLKYDPDTAMISFDLGGEGPALDRLQPKFIDWAGRPGTKIDINSMKQFLEFPVLLDDEFEEFFNDRLAWQTRKSMPRLSGLAEPLKNFSLPLSHSGNLRPFVEAYSTPAMRDMIEKCWKISDFYKELDKQRKKIAGELLDLGFPYPQVGRAAVAFDEYSDTLRGTIASLTDLFENEESVQRFLDEVHPKMIASIKAVNKDGSNTGKCIGFALHKGLDGFMSDEYYEKYYWRYLKELIETIISVGMTPYVFAEGRYSTRLHHLREVPKGKVVYKFEDTPMELAKKELGDVACITGGFSNVLLFQNTPEQVRDECKRMLDICAPGGGFIFQTKSSLTLAKRENVEAMFETVREYGKY